MSKDFKIIFVHGYTASSKENWYPNISKELNKLGVDFAIPDLPGGEYPHATEWLESIHKEAVKITKPLVLVGHSLGTRAILLYLEKYKPSVAAVFLIATFANRLENAKRRDGESYPDFFEHIIDLNQIKPLVQEFVVIHSKDDSSIGYNQGVEIAKSLGAKLVTSEDRDHIYEPSNAPYILSILRQELNF